MRVWAPILVFYGGPLPNELKANQTIRHRFPKPAKISKYSHPYHLFIGRRPGCVSPSRRPPGCCLPSELRHGPQPRVRGTRGVNGAQVVQVLDGLAIGADQPGELEHLNALRDATEPAAPS